MAKKILKGILFLILLLVFGFVGLLGWFTIREFDPPIITNLEIREETPFVVGDSLTLVSWNIGYFGLGKEMDFFYEGGKMVRPSRDLYKKYKQLAIDRISTFNGADFILLQEIDSFAKRSWYDNQITAIESVLPGYSGSFGLNYVAWVPVPFTEPMGKVRAGLATFSKETPLTSTRVSFESSYKWPLRLFQLKRCFIEQRYKTTQGKELIVINTHNSAFDDADELRKKELNKLKELMVNEYRKGNYIIIGGDWNQNPPLFDTANVLSIYKPRLIEHGIPDDFIPKGWVYAFDPEHSTNRDVHMPYKEGVTASTVLDFFIISPNIMLQEVNTIPTGFIESDHQPVIMKVLLKH